MMTSIVKYKGLVVVIETGVLSEYEHMELSCSDSMQIFSG